MEEKKENHLPEGTRIGHLTVKYRGRKKTGNSYFYHCECDCGSETDVDATKLEKRQQTACLCKGQFLEIGKTYGFLTVRKRIRRGIYACDCACGKKDVIVSTSDILKGSVKSCGCAGRPYNRKPRKDSTTGIRGVSINRKTGRYYAFIRKNGKNKYLGNFELPEEAKEARIKAEKEMRKTEQGDMI